MKITLNYLKSIEENIQEIYSEIKKLKKKRKGLEEIIEKDDIKLEKKKVEIKKSKEKKWYDKFLNFKTTNGFLAVAGRNAEQNEKLFKTYFEEQDLFFHADVQGASVVILKNGKNAKQQDIDECFQFSACFSKAWQMEQTALDVYCVGYSQVKKEVKGGILKKGSFGIEGKRNWKKIGLELKIGLDEDELKVLPMVSKIKLKKQLKLIPGGKQTKGKIAKRLAERYGVDVNLMLRYLPNGKISSIMI